MLIKLLKYDWKYSWRLLFLLNGALLLFSILGQLGSHLLQSGNYTVMSILAGMYILIYTLLFCGSLITTQIILIARYYRNFYTDEGYLLHTLPVTTGQKIWAKFINHMLWTLINILCLLLSILFLAGPGEWKYMFQLIPDTFSAFSKTLGIHPVLIALGGLLAIVLALSFMIFSLYFCISIGSLFPSHKVIASIVTYVILYGVVQFASLAYIIYSVFLVDRKIYTVNPSGIPVDPIYPSPAAGTFGVIYAVGMFLLLAGSAAFYGVSYYVAHKKLNLD